MLPEKEIVSRLTKLKIPLSTKKIMMDFELIIHRAARKILGERLDVAQAQAGRQRQASFP